MATSKVTVGYWAIRGLGQQVRNLLEYLHIPYEDVRYETYEQWNEKKAKFTVPFANLPYLEDGEKTLTESEAILAYLSQKANRLDLLGKEEDKIEFIQMRGIVSDIRSSIDQAIYGGKSVEEIKSKIEGFLGWRGHSKLSDLNDLLGKRDWLLGYLTYLDFNFVEYVERCIDMDHELGTKVTTDFPNLQAYVKRFNELPEIKEYKQSDRFKARPHNFHMAAWK